MLKAIKKSVNEKNYSWRELERYVPPNLFHLETSILRDNIPDLLVFKPKFMPDNVPIPLPVLPGPNFRDDSSFDFGDSKILQTLAHRKMVLEFVRG